MHARNVRPVLSAVAVVALSAMPLLLSIAFFSFLKMRLGSVWTVAQYSAILLLVRQLAAFTLSAQIHRSYSHDQFRFHPWLDGPLRVWNFFFMGSGRVWATMHRIHHKYSDSPLDPHSPVAGGSIWTILPQTSASYLKTGRLLHSTARYDRYAVGLPDDTLERFFVWSSSGTALRLVAMRIPLFFLLLVLALGPAAAVAFLPGIILSIWATTIIGINGVAHKYGYRNYPGKDSSTNILPIDFVGLGELLHHNHHVFPGRANFAIRRFEWDAGYWLLRALSVLGLVRELR